MKSLNLFDLAFVAPKVPPIPPTGLVATDDFESYSNGANVNGLNGSLWWAAGYVDKLNYLGIEARDDAESYADGAALNGLNGGEGFSGAYVNHDN